MQRIESRYSDLDHFAWGPQKKIEGRFILFLPIMCSPLWINSALVAPSKSICISKVGFPFENNSVLEKNVFYKIVGFSFLSSTPRLV